MHDETYGQFRIGHQIAFRYAVAGPRQDKVREVQILLKTHDEIGNCMYTTYDWDVEAPTARGHIRKYRSTNMYEVRDFGSFPIWPEVRQALAEWESQTSARVTARAEAHRT